MDIEKFNKIDNNKKISLTKLKDNETIGEIYDILKDKTDGSKEKIIKHISDTINTGYTFSTLRSYINSGRILTKNFRKSTKKTSKIYASQSEISDK